MGRGEEEVAGAVDEAVVRDRAVVAGSVLEGVKDVNEQEARHEAVAVVGGAVKAEEPESVVVGRLEGGHGRMPKE